MVVVWAGLVLARVADCRCVYIRNKQQFSAPAQSLQIHVWTFRSLGSSRSCKLHNIHVLLIGLPAVAPS